MTNEELLQKMVADFSEEFDIRCMDRHEMGAEKYGPVNFLAVDTVEMALEELLDLANYARYTFVKLRLLQEYIASKVADEEAEEITLGKEAVKNPHRKTS